MKEYFLKQITTREDAEQFYTKMYHDDLLFHPEDDASDIMVYVESPCPSAGGPTIHSEYPLFTEEEAQLVNERIDETWVVMKDPCKFILENFYKSNV